MIPTRPTPAKPSLSSAARVSARCSTSPPLDGTNGFVVNGIDAQDKSGRSVSGAGDFNGDGIDDIIIGAPGYIGESLTLPGDAYVLFGKTTFTSGNVNLNAITANDGIIIESDGGDEFFGYSVGAAGDVDGDGFDDVIIGRPGAILRPARTPALLRDIRGEFGNTVTNLGTTGADTFTGTSAADEMIGGQGDDTLVGTAATTRSWAASATISSASRRRRSNVSTAVPTRQADATRCASTALSASISRRSATRGSGASNRSTWTTVRRTR